MIKEARALNSHVVRKEKIQNSLQLLERQKLDETIKTDVYLKKKREYQKQMTGSVSMIAAVKGMLSNLVKSDSAQLLALQKKIDQQNLKHSAGKIDVRKFRRSIDVLQEQQSALTGQILMINKLLAARTGIETSAILGQLTGAQAGAFNGVRFMRSRVWPVNTIYGFIGSLMLMASIFFPWLSPSQSTGPIISLSAINLSLVLGWSGLIGGLLIIAISALPLQAWLRGTITIAIAVAVGIMLLTYWASLFAPIPGNSEYDSNVTRFLLGTADIREGFFIYIGGVILCALSGIISIAKGDVSHTNRRKTGISA